MIFRGLKINPEEKLCLLEFCDDQWCFVSSLLLLMWRRIHWVCYWSVVFKTLRTKKLKLYWLEIIFPFRGCNTGINLPQLSINRFSMHHVDYWINELLVCEIFIYEILTSILRHMRKFTLFLDHNLEPACQEETLWFYTHCMYLNIQVHPSSSTYLLGLFIYDLVQS